MKLTMSESKPTVGRCVATFMLALATILFLAPGVYAADDDASRILKAMSDYLTSQKGMSAKLDMELEVITSDIQKIQFSSSGEVIFSRPDKLRLERLGGYSHVELVFDGKMLTLVDKDRNVFGQAEASGTVDQLIDKLRQELGIELPGGDLLLSNMYDVLSAPILAAKHIGRGIVDGVECEHLAFRNADTDWQIWIEVGDRPVPRKYVITTKTMAAAPQYSLRLHDWSFDPAPGADAFKFTPPEGAKKVAIVELTNIDELPPPAAPGGGQ
ncbi:MAG: DUF2092 domain-containing protein [Dongiaceae bacterium]